MGAYPSPSPPHFAMIRYVLLVFAVSVVAFAAASLGPACLSAQDATAWVGARLWDGTGAAAVDDAVLLVQDGRVAAAGPRDAVEIPPGARVVDLTGRFLIPGLINTHGHVGSARGLASGPEVYTRENILDQLALNARYGVTTVVSLGGDGPEGVRIRDAQAGDAGLDRARLRVAGPVLDPASPEEARRQVAEAHALGVDWIKIRIDDGLGTRAKMAPEVYAAVIEEAHARGLPVAAHIVTLADAKALARADVDLLAHSVRDAPVDRELADLMADRGLCLVPTLTRELSVFAYAERPAFFDDPFFRAEVDPDVLEALAAPRRMARVAADRNAAWAREALPMAQANARRLAEMGATLAFGTDSGPAARFQGYFEHLEAELMAEADLSPLGVLLSATGQGARCVGLGGEVGTLTPGARADFLVLREDPLRDVRALRTLESVWIAGNRVPGAPPGP